MRLDSTNLLTQSTNFLSTLSKNKLFFLILTLVVGFMLVSPYLDYQPLLSQGDHGRDLYCYKQTSEGAKPYRDYWWQYGPLMPYYYGLSFKIFGVKIQSILWAKTLLVFLCGVFVYLICVSVLSPAVSFLTAFWFWVFRPEFFYTYNHVGGLLCILFVMYCLFRYYTEPQKMYIFWGSFSIVLLCLVRLNMGLVSLLGFVASLIVIDRIKNVSDREKKQYFYLTIAAITAVLVGCVYLYFIQGVTASNLKKCFPYLSSYRYDNVTLLKAVEILSGLVIKNLTASWRRIVFALILLFAGLRTMYSFINNKFDPASKAQITTSLTVLGIFLGLISHEFFVSGSLYRLFWIIPILVMFFFFLIDIGFRKLSQGVYVIVMMFLLFVSVRAALGVAKVIHAERHPINLFEYGPTKIYIANYIRGYEGDRYREDFDKRNHWITTVKETTNYIQNNTKPNAPILAIPYDPLYYFLTDRNSPVYPLAFFNYIRITPEEERLMIQQLEEKDVNYVILSNRIHSLEPHLGFFGREYCPLLAKYINDNFEIAATYGNWQDSPDFTRFHGTKIFQRK